MIPIFIVRFFLSFFVLFWKLCRSLGWGDSASVLPQLPIMIYYWRILRDSAGFFFFFFWRGGFLGRYLSSEISAQFFFLLIRLLRDPFRGGEGSERMRVARPQTLERNAARRLQTAAVAPRRWWRSRRPPFLKARPAESDKEKEERRKRKKQQQHQQQQQKKKKKKKKKKDRKKRFESNYFTLVFIRRPLPPASGFTTWT